MRERSCYYFDGRSREVQSEALLGTNFLEKRLPYKPHKRRSHPGPIADYPLWSPFSCLSGDNIGASWTLDGVLGCYYVIGIAFYVSGINPDSSLAVASPELMDRIE
jgi:hypothetical protein